MQTPTVVSVPLGRRTETVFFPPYSVDDWKEMARILGDAEMQGCTAQRFISDDAVKITIQETT